MTNVPEIRFKGFTDAWEQRKLGEVKDVRDGTHDSPKYFQIGHPLVTSKNLAESGLDMTNVSLISNKDFIEINKRSKVDVGDIIFAMIGTIGNPVIVDRNDFAIKNVALIKNGGDVPNYFLLQLLKSPSFNNYIQVENAGNTQKFLGLSKIRDYDFAAPSFDEMHKIGSFFRTLDNTILLHKRKHEMLKKLKKGYLQQMFPQEGEYVPRVRFKGFTGDWVERKLGDIVNWSKGQGLSKDELNENGIGTPALHYADLYKFNAVEKSIIHWTESTNGKIIPNNSILFPMSDVTPNGLARTTTLMINGVKAGGDVLIGELCQEVISIFISYQVNANYKAILPFVTGTTVKHINATSLSELDLFIPTMKEQTAIGNFFRNLDEQIIVQQIKLDKLKQLKSAYLQKMFI